MGCEKRSFQDGQGCKRTHAWLKKATFLIDVRSRVPLLSLKNKKIKNDTFAKKSTYARQLNDSIILQITAVQRAAQQLPQLVFLFLFFVFVFFFFYRKIIIDISDLLLPG